MQAATKELPIRWKTLVIIAAILASVVLLTGITTLFAVAPDRLIITGSFYQPQSVQVVAQQTIGDPSQVRAIYQLVEYLPDVPRGATTTVPPGCQHNIIMT